jgi:hypothetical protein
MVGNGNVGYVLEAKDGLVVATTDGTKIMEVLTFQTIDEVNQYEKDTLAKAETAKQAYEASKIKVSGSGDTASDGIKLSKFRYF